MPKTGKQPTEAQRRALEQANNRRRREALARKAQKAAEAEGGSLGAVASVGVVSSASAPTPTPYAEAPVSVGVVSPLDVGDNGPIAEEDHPQWAERLSDLRPDDKTRTPPPRDPKKAPSERELTDFFAEKLLRWLMIFYVSWLTAPLEWPADEQRRLIAPPADRKAMVTPLARLAAQTHLNERIGRKVLDADDVVDALVMFGIWIDSTRPILRQRQAAKAAQRGQAPLSQPTHPEAPHEPARPGPTGSGEHGGGGVAYLPGAFPPGGAGA